MDRAPCSIPVFCTTNRHWPTHSSSSQRSFQQVSSPSQCTHRSKSTHSCVRHANTQLTLSWPVITNVSGGRVRGALIIGYCVSALWHNCHFKKMVISCPHVSSVCICNAVTVINNLRKKHEAMLIWSAVGDTNSYPFGLLCRLTEQFRDIASSRRRTLFFCCLQCEMLDNPPFLPPSISSGVWIIGMSLSHVHNLFCFLYKFIVNITLALVLSITVKLFVAIVMVM